MASDSSKNTPSFVAIQEGLCGDGITFDPSWPSKPLKEFLEANPGEELPVTLPLPDFCQVFEYVAGEDNEETLQKLGCAARDVVNSAFSVEAPAVLFRNLNSAISSADDFLSFWKGCLEDSDTDDGTWKPMEYVPFGAPRNTLGGIDLVTTFPPAAPLPCHNEMAYNPMSPSKIAFYCLAQAKTGGETLLVRNAMHTETVSKELQQQVKDHGGILYTRTYPDASSTAKGFMPSWQQKTNTEDKELAIQYFTDIGFDVKDVYFENEAEDDDKEESNNTCHSLIVNNVNSGFNEQDDWFNVFQMGWFTLADGTRVSQRDIQQLALDEWKNVHAVKLAPGDWIVLNNKIVQHGRLPYENGSEEHEKRTILTVYAE